MLTREKANQFIEKHKNNVVQTYRHEYHFMSPVGWINDPNGFIYFKGEYHLFYQYNPYDSVWGPMYWGHAKSKDLITWEHLPVALAPDQPYDKDGCFSGTAIEKDGKLYLMYTGHILGEKEEDTRQVQCVAVSSDGINFEKVEQNPVLTEADLPSNALPQDFRDPKVLEKNGKYYKIIVSKTKKETGQILLYSSSDLITWDFVSILLEGTTEEGIMWECPDIFELDGKDVIVMSPIDFPKEDNHYYNTHTSLIIVGKMDWEKGLFQKEWLKEIDHSMDFYAPQTTIDDKGRRIVIAWMQMWGRNMPTDTEKHGWAGSMVLPRELSLVNNQLYQKPITEIENYLTNERVIENQVLQDEEKEFENIKGNVAVLEVEIDIEEDSRFEIKLHANDKEKTLLSYESKTGLLELNRKDSGYEISGDEKEHLYKRGVYCDTSTGKLTLKIFLDRSSVEVFINGGIDSMTATVYPKEEAKQIKFASKGKVNIERLTQWDVKL